MKFTLAIFALLSASVSSLKVDATVEAQSLTSIDMMMLANVDEELELEKMTPAQ